MKAGKQESHHRVYYELTKKERETLGNLTADQRKLLDKYIDIIYNHAVMEALMMIERYRTRLKPPHDVNKCEICRHYRDGLKMMGIIIDVLKEGGVKELAKARLVTRQVHERAKEQMQT